MKNLQKHKICILVPTHWEHTMGGAQYQAKLLVEHLLKLGRFEVHYLASRIHPTFIPEAYELHKIGNSEGSGSLMDTVGLLRTLNQIKPATIYQHVGCANTGVAAYYCKKNQCKLVWHIASDWDVEPWDPPLSKYFSSDFLNRKTFEYGLKNADCIVGQTKLQGRLLYKNYGRNLTKLVRNFHPIPRESINKSGQIQILWIANIKKVKQPELFIKLAQDLSHLNARFVIAGVLQGNKIWREDIAKRIKKTKNIDYLGGISQEEVNVLFARGHVLVNTSKYEGFSNTFVQAWMRQVPVLSYSVNPDELLQGTTLGACADGNYVRLKSMLEELINDDGKRSDMGATAQEYAFEKHSDKNMDALIDLFEN